MRQQISIFCLACCHLALFLLASSFSSVYRVEYCECKSKHGAKHTHFCPKKGNVNGTTEARICLVPFHTAPFLSAVSLSSVFTVE